jgi:hypothetical protein
MSQVGDQEEMHCLAVPLGRAYGISRAGSVGTATRWMDEWFLAQHSSERAVRASSDRLQIGIVTADKWSAGTSLAMQVKM